MIRLSKTLRTLAACVCLCFAAAPLTRAVVQPGLAPMPATKVPGMLTVQFEDNVNTVRFQRAFGSVSTGISSVDQILISFKVGDIHPIFTHVQKPAVNSGKPDLTRFYQISFPDSIPLDVVINALRQNPNVRSAEPVWQYYTDATPNDPQYLSQWNMSPIGPDPQFYYAWDLETGSDSIKVAIIDTGVLYNHPDLKGNIWVNPGEDINHNGVVYDVDDLNGIDDDGDGFVDDLIGYDFVTSISNPAAGEDAGVRDPDPSDFNGHGTHCSGIVAAMNNNATNVTGAAGGWYGGSRSFRGIRIMCLRAGGSDNTGRGTLNSNDLADAVNYATMMHANAINASWGGGGYSLPLLTAIQNAVNAGITFAHSAGNDGVDNIGYEDQIPGVLSVAATTATDAKASFSNYGTWIDVSAPGQGILSTYSFNYTPGTAVLDGTSMAAPAVAGVSALIRSMMPSLTRQQVDSVLVNTADNIDANNPSYAGKLGSGRINAFHALQGLANAKFSANVTEGNVPLAVQFTDNSPNSPSSWNWNLGDGTTPTVQNPNHTYTTAGMYSVGLKINEARGLGEEYLNNYVWVRADTLKFDSVGADPGTKAVVSAYLRNTSQIQDITIPFTLANSEGLTLDSFSVVGCRTSGFNQVTYSAYDDFSQNFAIKFISSPNGHYFWMPSGAGAIVKLYINVPLTATRGVVVTLDTLTQGFAPPQSPNVTSQWGNYWPVYKAGKIKIGACRRGKALCGSGVVDGSDLAALVSFLTAGTPAVDPYGANMNGLGIIDSADIAYLVAYLTAGGPPPPQ